ncbi:MAG: amino acid ABC transporter substrate-binding protein [Burkholderiales bacterium]
MSRWLLAAALVLPLATAQAGARLDKIKASGKITVAVAEDAAPFAFRTKGGEPDGYSIELCRKAVASIQKQLKLDKLQIAWAPASTPERLKMVADGRADLECGVTTHTLSREANVGFSLPIFIDGGGILVPQGSPIVALPGLEGQKVAVVKGTTTEKRLTELLKQRAIAGQVLPAKDRKLAFAMLNSGEVQAYAGDRAVLIGQALSTKTSAPGWTLLDLEISYEPYAFAVPRDEPDLRLAVDRAIAETYRSRHIEDIYERWFGKFGPPQPLLRAMFILNRIPQ